MSARDGAAESAAGYIALEDPHGSTLGGNLLACEALKVTVDECLPQRAMELGTCLMDCLQGIRSGQIALCRGKGLLLGIVLRPEAGGARRYCEALRERGVLAEGAGRLEIIDSRRFCGKMVLQDVSSLRWCSQQTLF